MSSSTHSTRARTRDYWRECLAALQKSWPGLNETEIRKITQADCKKWASAYAKTASPTRYNNTVAVLRHVLNVAAEAGVVYSNVAAVVKRAAVRSKEISLPTIDKLNAMIAAMRARHSRTLQLGFLGDRHKGDRLSARATQYSERGPALLRPDKDDSQCGASWFSGLRASMAQMSN